MNDLGLPVRFEIYEKRHQDEVATMMAEFYAIDSYPFDMEKAKVNLAHFASDESLGRLYVVRVQDQLAGYIVLAFGFSFERGGRDAFVDELYIRQAFRNQGIGKLTMQHIESVAKSLQVNALHLEVEPHNQHALQLYTRRGFRDTNRKLLTKSISTHPKDG